MRSLHQVFVTVFVAVFVACVFGSAACGPGELPGFANPPPEPDAGAAMDASDDEDAGNPDAESR